MKTKFFKMILPAFVLLAAVTASLAFKTAEEQLVPETGWVSLPGSPCEIEVECKTDPGAECTLFYDNQHLPARGMVSGSCTKTLQRID